MLPFQVANIDSNSILMSDHCYPEKRGNNDHFLKFKKKYKA